MIKQAAMDQIKARINELETWLGSHIEPDRYAGESVIQAYRQEAARLYAELLELRAELLPFDVSAS